MQIALNIAHAAAMITLVSLSFAIIYSTARFFHFAHAASIAAGAYGTLAVHQNANTPFWIAALCGVGCSVVVGCTVYFVIYRPLQRKGASPLILLLASLGSYLVVQNCVSLGFGDGVRVIRLGEVKEGVYLFGGRLTISQVCVIAASGLCLLAYSWFSRRTRLGCASRAVGCNRELAITLGLNETRVLVSVFAVGSAVAGLAGVLLAVDVGLYPTMGLNPLMIALVAVCIAGGRRPLWVVCAAIGLSLAQSLVMWTAGSSWRDAGVFAILLVFLLVASCRRKATAKGAAAS